MAAASNNALGTTAGATTVNAGATLDLRNAAITGEQLNLAAATAPAAASISNSTGTNTWTGNISITGGTANDKVQIDTSSGAQLTISGVISQATNAKDLVTTGAGNLTLTGANTITGAVNINGSGGAITTLADASGSALGNISGITVNTGNILTLGANNQINDSANLTLSGGRFNVNGYSETMRQLTQTVGSTIDYLNDGNPATTTDLGIGGIWLMPVFESPSYHGYDVVDYRKIEQDYGTSADFKALSSSSPGVAN